MHKKKERRRNLTMAILSLSLFTVMAGAAVAPALKVIQDYFCDVNQALVQMVISIPALFIFLTNMIFPKLCKYFRAKELTLAGISWRASFLVYLMGLLSIVLCVLFLPNEKISMQGGKKEKGVFKKYYAFIIAMFLLMFTFFAYPSTFAIETAKEGIIPRCISVY